MTYTRKAFPGFEAAARRRWLQRHAVWHSRIEPGLGGTPGTPDAVAMFRAGGPMWFVEFKAAQRPPKRPLRLLRPAQYSWFVRLVKAGGDALLVILYPDGWAGQRASLLLAGEGLIDELDVRALGFPVAEQRAIRIEGVMDHGAQDY